MKFVYGVLLLPLISVCSAIAQQSGNKHEDTERIYVLNELEFFIDTLAKYQLNEVITDAERLFSRDSTYRNKDYKAGYAYWIRFPIYREQLVGSDHWLIEFYDQTIDSLDVFIPTENGAYNRKPSGDRQSFLAKDFMHKNFVFPIENKADSMDIYYFRVWSHEFADIRIAIRSVNRFVEYALIEYFLFGFFYGMVAIIILYNLLVSFAIKERKYVYYIFYLISVGLYALSLDGIGFQYVWPERPGYNEYAVGIAQFFVIVWSLIFTRSFLNTAVNDQKLDKWLFHIMIIRSSIFVVSLMFFPSFMSNRTVDVLPLLFIFYTGVQVWYKGYRPARFFVIAYGILFLGFFLRILVYFNFIPFTILSHYSLHLAFVFEMLFLTFALGDRIRYLKDNRDKALRRIIQQNEHNIQLQEKVNRELEEKVAERTAELNQKNDALEISNQKLVLQAREINQINSMLDLDNWKLKNKIKEVLNERFMDKLLNYEEFKTIYPNELSCYQFLENLKWGKSFHCRKCGNEKYFKGSRKFSRRCTKCGYNESITSHTIFKSLKFPIEKAFYIAYVEVSGKKEYTLDALSIKLDVALNTVWSFKQKVAEKVAGLEKNGIKTTPSQWEIIALDADKHSHHKSSKMLKEL